MKERERRRAMKRRRSYMCVCVCAFVHSTFSVSIYEILVLYFEIVSAVSFSRSFAIVGQMTICGQCRY